MEEARIVALLLLIPVMVDAVGDALRLRDKLVLHHIMEVLHIGCWISLWGMFGFDMWYVAFYILGRIILFDIVFNLSAGLPIGYVGSTSIYDSLLRLFGDWVKQHPANFAFITRALALVVWVALFIRS